MRSYGRYISLTLKEIAKLFSKLLHQFLTSTNNVQVF